MMIVHRIPRMTIACAVLLSAMGCVSVLPDAPPAAARYLIAPAEIEAAPAPDVAWSLAVEDPQSTRVFDTTKMALVRSPGRVEYYAAGEWADRAPRLVQAAIVRSFENSGRILSVGDRSSLPFSDFILKTDIRTMHAAYDGNRPTATVEIFARLTNPRGKVIAARLFSRQAPATRDGEQEVAAAFNEAMAVMLADIVEWSFAEANAAYAK